MAFRKSGSAVSRLSTAGRGGGGPQIIDSYGSGVGTPRAIPGVRAGDLILFYARTADLSATPVGYTLLGQRQQGTEIVRLFSKIAAVDGSETPPFSIAATGISGSVLIRGHAGTGQVATSGTTTSPSAPMIAMQRPAMVLIASSKRIVSILDAPTNTPFPFLLTGRGFNDSSALITPMRVTSYPTFTLSLGGTGTDSALVAVEVY